MTVLCLVPCFAYYCLQSFSSMSAVRHVGCILFIMYTEAYVQFTFCCYDPLGSADSALIDNLWRCVLLLDTVCSEHA